MSSPTPAVNLLQSPTALAAWLPAAPERSTSTERTIPMFFENEPTRTLTLIEFLLVMLIGLVPVAITMWMNPVFSRGRVAEEKRDSLARADHRSREAAGGQVCFLGDSRAILPSSRIMHRSPASCDVRSEQPLGLFVVNRPRRTQSPQSEKEEKQSPAIW